MSRRRPPSEVQFGSDSFLDVLANIVGILIILIVVAGLQVSRLPVVPMPASELEAPDSIPIIDTASIPLLTRIETEPTPPPQVVISQPAVEPEDEEDVPEPIRPPLPELIVPRELVDLSSQLESEIAELKDAETRLEVRLNQSGRQQSVLLERQKAIQQKLTEKTQELDLSRKQVAKFEADMELAKETLARLNKQVQELESVPVNVETLEHKITPISRVVSGKEKHYRLEKNRVLEVPLDELAGRLRDQLERRKDWLAKTRQHRGQIGPIRDFSMLYQVRIESLSELASVSAGHGGFRVAVRWEIQPEPEAKGETEEVALRRGSQFYQSILGTPSDTTLTFWVYPDSYAIYRKLQTFAHEHGYSVAGRPLPHGMNICGSPDGSKSASE